MKQFNNKQNNTPLVSVIIPVFNGSSFLEETVYSVQNSSYKNFEILLIDDGSTDKSRHICQKLEKKYANIHFYSFSKNKGLGRVLNFVLKKARGEYICRINQDDLMLRLRITTQVVYLQNHPQVVAVGSSIRLFDSQGKTQIVHFLKTDKQIKKVWHIVSPFSDPSVMYRKSVALKVGGYNQEYWPADDTHLWIRMGLIGTLANIDKPLVEVRYHADAASVKHFRKLAFSTYKMHIWMHEYIKPVSFWTRIFWMIELIAGLLLSPDNNWKAYRILKKLIYLGTLSMDLFRKSTAKIKTLLKLNNHPIALRRSGK